MHVLIPWHAASGAQIGGLFGRDALVPAGAVGADVAEGDGDEEDDPPASADADPASLAPPPFTVTGPRTSSRSVLSLPPQPTTSATKSAQSAVLSMK